jgi:hypothetical protein
MIESIRAHRGTLMTALTIRNRRKIGHRISKTPGKPKWSWIMPPIPESTSSRTTFQSSSSPLLHFVENVLVSYFNADADNATFRFDLSPGLPSYREQIDRHVIKLWAYLDQMSNEYVSSDELVAYCFASEILEIFLEKYEIMYDVNVNNPVLEAVIPRKFLDWLVRMLRLIKWGSDFGI